MKYRNFFVGIIFTFIFFLAPLFFARAEYIPFDDFEFKTATRIQLVESGRNVRVTSTGFGGGEISYIPYTPDEISKASGVAQLNKYSYLPGEKIYLAIDAGRPTGTYLPNYPRFNFMGTDLNRKIIKIKIDGVELANNPLNEIRFRCCNISADVLFLYGNGVLSRTSITENVPRFIQVAKQNFPKIREKGGSFVTSNMVLWYESLPSYFDRFSNPTSMGSSFDNFDIVLIGKAPSSLGIHTLSIVNSNRDLTSSQTHQIRFEVKAPVIPQNCTAKYPYKRDVSVDSATDMTPRCPGDNDSFSGISSLWPSDNRAGQPGFNIHAPDQYIGDVCYDYYSWGPIQGAKFYKYINKRF